MKGGKVKRIKSSKGKRWKKGHSSDSNPQNKTHRTAAKNKNFSIHTGPSELTLEALAIHDAKTSTLPGQDDDSNMDTQTTASFGAKTFQTWATNWTDCTNATFSKVHRHWGTNNAMQKEVLAVLAAITEVIKKQGGKEADTEYFAALMTMLEQGMDEEISLAAALYLLSLSIKRTPVAVLKKSFSAATKMLLDFLVNYADSENTTLIKSSLHCIAGLLRVQDKAAWSNAATMQVYHSLLAFTTHAKPRVRKEAQHAVRVVLKTPAFLETSTHHPAAPATATYCVTQIEQAGADATTTLHLLGLLQHLLSTFPQNSLKAACETILRAMTLANVVVTSVALRTLHGLFISDPSPKCMPPQLNAQIINALYDFQPGEQDTQPMAAWMRVMEAAYVNLSKNDEEMCLRHLPRMVRACMKCLLRGDSAKSAATTLNALITTCLPASRERIAAMAKQPKSPVHDMVGHLEGGLSYQYHAVWAAVLACITAFFKTVGGEVSGLCSKLLLSMSDLRDSMSFPYRGEVDAAVGAAVATMGPKVVLDAVPLHITGNEDNCEFPRSWLIPVIRDNVTHTQLAFFISYFLPLAAKLRKNALDYEYGGRQVLAKSYDALQNQIWSMLPGFCTKPTDLPQSMRSLAKLLGETLNTRVDLRLTVLSGLRRLVQHSLEDEASKEEMSRYAKNYLPILFNLYTTQTEVERDPKRMAVLETAKVYFQITDKKLVATLFEECVGKLSAAGEEKEELSSFRRHALMDLLILLLPYIPLPALQRLYDLVIPLLTHSDKTVQKKAYRLLEEVCGGGSEACQQLVTARLADLQQHLTASLSSSSPSARAPRLRCLGLLLAALPPSPQATAFLEALVPEAILCTKELATKARTAAFNLLTTTGQTLARWSGGTVKDVQRELFALFLAGLGGDAHMIACTVLALTKLIYDFRAELDVGVVRELVSATCLLLRSKAREVVVAAVGLLKLLVTITPESTLAQDLPDIVSSLVAMKAENKHNLRFRNKEIYARLIRKFGYEVILKLVPQSHHKILVNIKKTQERKERKKKEEKDDSDSDEEADKMAKSRPETIDDLLHESDSEMEEEEEKKKKKVGKENRKKGKGKAWIKEGEEDEDIVDFLDPSVNQKVMATKPSEKANEAKKIKHDFKTASDGRLIITEGSDEEDGGPAMDEAEELDDLLEAMGGGRKKPKKRKLEDLMDDEEDAPPAKSGYKPGGHGIHRPIGKHKSEADVGSEYKAKKAKGDVKKKGAHDPYAYIKLDTTLLNRRKKAKAKGQFANLVKGAKRGASKGQKMKSKGKR